MQLALTPEVLFPLVAGTVVAIAAIAIIVAIGRGKRTSVDEPAGDLTAADWTGEAAAGDPAAAVATRVAIVGPHRLTVAEAVAVREADTAPLPVSSSAFLVGPPAPGPSDGPASAAAVAAAPASGESGTATPAEPPAAAPSDDGSASPEPARPAAVSSPSGTLSVPDPRPAANSSGSGQTVAAAVAQALAARAALRDAPSEVTVPAARPEAENARDRLLAVLLDDPERAVGAVEELETRRGQLGEVLHRLVASGLSVDQLARLSGFPADEVRGLLAQHQRLG